jgi:thiol-disulfide isomerase/thioredoxin
LAQSNYQILKDPKNGEPVYKGACTFQDLHADGSFTWLKHGYDKYKPNAQHIAFLKKHLANYTFIVFIGTWCSDTHDMLPKLEKVLTAANYPLAKLTMFGVDREKKAKNIENKLYGIESVPTIIVFKGHLEIGRITETVKTSVEEDLVNILKTDTDKNAQSAHE